MLTSTVGTMTTTHPSSNQPPERPPNPYLPDLGFTGNDWSWSWEHPAARRARRSIAIAYTVAALAIVAAVTLTFLAPALTR